MGLPSRTHPLHPFNTSVVGHLEQYLVYKPVIGADEARDPSTGKFSMHVQQRYDLVGKYRLVAHVFSPHAALGSFAWA